MKLLPHCRTMTKVVFPIHIETCVLARHYILVAYRLRSISVQEPLEVVAFVKFPGQLSIVAFVWQPAERDNIEVTPAASSFLWTTPTRTDHCPWLNFVRFRH